MPGVAVKAPPAIGICGKIPTQGDFLTGRAPGAAARPLEAWISAGIAAARTRWGGDFAAVWRVAPMWRFAARAGVLGPEAVAGVLCPSVDSGGREYPLALFAIFAADPEPVAVLDEGADWFAALETLALEALDGALDPDGLAARLDDLSHRAPAPPSAAVAPVREGRRWRLRVGSDGRTIPGAYPLALDVPPDRPSSAWITVGGALTAPRGEALGDLPTPAFFADLLIAEPEDG